MKSIEERAKEYIQDIYGGPYTDVELGFIRGAQSEHEELTRWNSPEEHPDNYREVLVKIKRYADNSGHPIPNGIERFSVASFTDGGWLKHFDSPYYKVISWREIHE